MTPTWQQAVNDYVAKINAGMLFHGLHESEIEHVIREGSKLLYGTDYPAPQVSAGDGNAVVLTWTAEGKTAALQLGQSPCSGAVWRPIDALPVLPRSRRSVRHRRCR